MDLALRLLGLAACMLIIVVGVMEGLAWLMRPSPERRQWQETVLGLARQRRRWRMK